MIFYGNASQKLAQQVAKYSQIPLGKILITQHPDQELKIEIKEDVANKKVYIVQSTSPPANQHYMEIFFIANALILAKVKTIILVMPYFGYARQDKPFSNPFHQPFGPQLIINLLFTANIHILMSVDLHNTQIKRLFSLPIIEINHHSIFLPHILKHNNPETIVVSPDVGSKERAKLIANAFNHQQPIIMNKTRLENNLLNEKKVKYTQQHYDVNSKSCIIVDDIIDTGNTLCEAALVLKACGAKKISAYVTHGVFSNNAIRKVQQSCIDELIITDTIDIQEKLPLRNFKKIKVISIAPILAKTILHHEFQKMKTA